MLFYSKSLHNLYKKNDVFIIFFMAKCATPLWSYKVLIF